MIWCAHFQKAFMGAFANGRLRVAPPKWFWHREWNLLTLRPRVKRCRRWWIFGLFGGQEPGPPFYCAWRATRTRIFGFDRESIWVESVC